MSKITERMASEAGIEPAYIKGREKHGLCFFTWEDSNSVGAQCGYCNNVVWTDPRKNTILNEKKPDHVPNSGEGYKRYYKENLKRFLDSIPSCPVCHKSQYDKFINNVLFPRLADGTPFDDEDPDVEVDNQDPSSIKIWWYEEKAEVDKG